MFEQLDRRKFLKTVVAVAVKGFVGEIPEWVDDIEQEYFDELVRICEGVLTSEEILDVLDMEDLDEALGLVFSFLITKDAIDPMEFLIVQGFLSDE